MVRLVVRNISNTKMPTKKIQRHWLKYDVKAVISFFQRFFKFSKYLIFVVVQNRYIYGYFSRLPTDFDQTFDQI